MSVPPLSAVLIVAQGGLIQTGAALFPESCWSCSLWSEWGSVGTASPGAEGMDSLGRGRTALLCCTRSSCTPEPVPVLCHRCSPRWCHWGGGGGRRGFAGAAQGGLQLIPRDGPCWDLPVQHRRWAAPPRSRASILPRCCHSCSGTWSAPLGLWALRGFGFLAVMLYEEYMILQWNRYNPENIYNMECQLRETCGFCNGS